MSRVPRPVRVGGLLTERSTPIPYAAQKVSYPLEYPMRASRARHRHQRLVATSNFARRTDLREPSSISPRALRQFGLSRLSRTQREGTTENVIHQACKSKNQSGIVAARCGEQRTRLGDAVFACIWSDGLFGTPPSLSLGVALPATLPVPHLALPACRSL